MIRSDRIAKGIYWDRAWNPLTGCSHSGSPGCDHCWASKLSRRLRGRYGYPEGNPFKVTFHPERLQEIFQYKKAQIIFVCDMGDMFHPDVTDYDLARIWSNMCLCGDAPGTVKHTFLILTKRVERMAEWVFTFFADENNHPRPCPDHIWLGTSIENFKYYERAEKLIQIPAAHRFLSIEPMLGPVSYLSRYFTGHICADCGWECFHHERPLDRKKNLVCPQCGSPYCADKEPKLIDWVICGSESGASRRPAKTEWIGGLKAQCVEAKIPFFLKQMEVDGKLVKMPEFDGRTWDQLPEVLSNH